jgi:hypothetical protein
MGLLFGKQSTNEMTPLLVDSLGRLLVSNNEPSPNNPTGEIINYVNLNLAAGNPIETIYTIPAGRRYLVTQLNVQYVGTVATVILTLYATHSGNNIILFKITPPVSANYYVILANVLLEAGDTINCEVANATLNDDFRGYVAMQRYK